MKTALKRTFSLILTVVMLVSCWVFTAPKADAATTTYTWRVYVDSRNATGGWNSETMKVYGKGNNGTGSEVELLSVSNWKIDFKGTRDNTFGKGNQTTSKFPTKLYYAYSFGGGVTHRKLDADLYLQLYYDGKWNTIASGTVYSYEWGTNSGNKTFTVGSGNYPRPTTNGSESFSNVTFPKSGTIYSSTTATSNLVDQYGVTYNTANFSISSATSSYSGCTPTISGTKVTVPTQVATSGVNTQTITATCCWSSNHSDGNRTYNKTFTVTDAKYTATYKYYTTNTSTLSSPTLNTVTASDSYKAYYGDKPSAPTLPATSYYDNSKHWSGGSYTAPTLTADQDVWPSYSTNGVSHTGFSYLSSGAKTASTHTVKCSGCAYTKTQNHTSVADPAVAATCTEPGKTAGAHCSVCSYVTTAQTTTAALGHTGDNVAHETLPANEKPGITYYECTRCHTCWGAVKNNDTYTKDPSNEQAPDNKGNPNIDAVITNTSAANVESPAPAFNIFVDPSMGNYPYSNRGAGLKIAGSTGPYDFEDAELTDRNGPYYKVTQGMRFVGSMHIPAGVSYTCGAEGDNVITDFGYVWSQTSLIHNNIDELEMNMPYVQKTSVKANNSGKGTFNGSNWTGVTMHNDSLGGKTLTFNLVVNVRAGNWKQAYCARAYITYKYNGTEYTVYDSSFSSRDVAYIANAVVESPNETPKVKGFCQTKIIDNLSYIPA